MKKVLFVCLGNICRSPMAEGIFKDQKHPRLHIESRATSNWEHGNPVFPGTKEILKDYDVDTDTMSSEQISSEDFDSFDYIIGMDNQNVRDLKAIAPEHHHHKIHLFLDVVDKYKGKDVPDPWHTHNFKETQFLIEEALPYWLTLFDEALMVI